MLPISPSDSLVLPLLDESRYLRICVRLRVNGRVRYLCGVHWCDLVKLRRIGSQPSGGSLCSRPRFTRCPFTLPIAHKRSSYVDLFEGLIVQDHVEQGLMDLDAAVVFNKS
jgi:hypothetical protein